MMTGEKKQPFGYKAAISVLLKKDLLVARHLLRIIREDSVFKTGFILLFATGMIGGLFYLFYDGFNFLAEFGGAGFMVTRSLFSLFFLGLGLMLFISSIVSSYATFFRSRDLEFLLTSPFDIGIVSFYKSLESALLSSWTFFFIIIPFAGAYAIQQHLGIMFGVWIFIFSMPFLLFCSALGSLVTLVGVRWIPRGKKLALLLLIITFAAVYWYFIRIMRQDTVKDAEFILTKIVPGLKLASLPFLPSWWTAEGLKAFARGDWGRGWIMFSVIMSNALMLNLILYFIGKRIFYDAYLKVISTHSNSSRAGYWSKVLNKIFYIFPGDMRAIILKDIRTFFRDAQQWSQALIFFGLLAIYFMSIRSFHYDMLPYEWKNMVSFLNVFSIAAVQCSLASRFIYPQLSLEGQAFWILGLSPVTAGRILVIKFMAAFAAMLTVSVTLVLISSYMLNTDVLIRGISLFLVIMISLAISALSTGLGAVFIDLKKTNSAAIVSGFGGTVNLVISLGYILVAVLPYALLFHFARSNIILLQNLKQYLWWCCGGLIIITLLVTVVPLVMGRKTMLNRDY